MNKRVLLIMLGTFALTMLAFWGISSYYTIAHDSESQKENTQEQGSLGLQEGATPGTNEASLGSAGSSGGGGRGGSGGGASSDSSSSGDTATTENQENRVYCTPESREVETCEPNDTPVCGWFDPNQTDCGNGPCVRSTFPNECEACMSSAILYWTEGECPIHD